MGCGLMRVGIMRGIGWSLRCEGGVGWDGEGGLGGVVRWEGRRAMTGGLALICARRARQVCFLALFHGYLPIVFLTPEIPHF